LIIDFLKIHQKQVASYQTMNSRPLYELVWMQATAGWQRPFRDFCPHEPAPSIPKCAELEVRSQNLSKLAGMLRLFFYARS
jgi:hypothetical protein